MGTDPLTQNLDDTIIAAVNARVEAAVMAALAGDETIGQFVAAALAQEVGETGYGRDRRKITFLHQTVSKAIQEMTVTVLAEVLENERDLVETEIRKALRRYIPNIAEGLAENLVGVSRSGGYRISVQPMED